MLRTDSASSVHHVFTNRSVRVSDSYILSDAIAMPRDLHRFFKSVSRQMKGPTSALKAAFGIKRQITIRGDVVVDSAGRAHFVPADALTFWSFYDIFALLAFFLGGLVAIWS